MRPVFVHCRIRRTRECRVFFREEVGLPDTQSPGAPLDQAESLRHSGRQISFSQDTVTTDFQWTMTGRSRVLQRCKKAFHSETPSFPPVLLARGGGTRIAWKGMGIGGAWRCRNPRIPEIRRGPIPEHPPGPELAVNRSQVRAVAGATVLYRARASRGQSVAGGGHGGTGRGRSARQYAGFEGPPRRCMSSRACRAAP